MSVKVTSWVWSIEQNNPVDRLILLAIADCAADDGGNAWPSMTTLARKACVTRRGAQIAVGRLVDAGLVRVNKGGGRARCNSYTVLIKSEQRSQLPNPGVTAKGEPETVNDVRSEQETVNVAAQRANVEAETVNVGSPRTSFNRPTTNPTRARGWVVELQRELERFYGKPYPVEQVLEIKRLVTQGIDTTKVTAPAKYVMAAVRKDPDRYKLTDLPPLLVGRGI